MLNFIVNSIMMLFIITSIVIVNDVGVYAEGDYWSQKFYVQPVDCPKGFQSRTTIEDLTCCALVFPSDDADLLGVKNLCISMNDFTDDMDLHMFDEIQSINTLKISLIDENNFEILKKLNVLSKSHKIEFVFSDFSKIDIWDLFQYVDVPHLNFLQFTVCQFNDSSLFDFISNHHFLNLETINFFSVELKSNTIDLFSDRDVFPNLVNIMLHQVYSSCQDIYNILFSDFDSIHIFEDAVANCKSSNFSHSVNASKLILHTNYISANFIADFFYKSNFTNLKELTVVNARMNDSDISNFFIENQTLKNLVELNLASNNGGMDAIRSIASYDFKHLKILVLDNFSLTSESVLYLSTMINEGHIEKLRMRYIKTTDDVLISFLGQLRCNDALDIYLNGSTSDENKLYEIQNLYKDCITIHK